MKVETVACFQAFLYRNDIPFVHLSAREWLAKTAKKRFLESLSVDELDDRKKFSFGVCQMSGAGGLHVPVLFLEDPESMPKEALSEAKLIPAPRDGQGPMLIEIYR